MEPSIFSRQGQIAPSELILNDDGTVYHIGLTGAHVKDNVIVVGDMARVDRIARHFDTVEHTAKHREFYTKVGRYKDKEITVMSTGIGPDNIDIALNELDVAANIDLSKKQFKADKRSLKIIRIGTCGALQEDVAVDSFVASKYGLGFDGVLNYYKTNYSKDEKSLRDAFIHDTAYPSRLAKPYVVEGDQDLRLKVAYGMQTGITATAPGFYAPQSRILRLELEYPELRNSISSFEWKEERVLNFEMETSAIYGLGALLGHKTTTVCAVIANRIRGEFSEDYLKTVDNLIETVLDRL